MRRRRRLLAALGAALLAAAAGAGCQGAASPEAARSAAALPDGVYCQGPAGDRPPSSPTKVLVVVGENTSSSVVTASRQAPFMNGVLTGQCGLLANMHGETHASEANYHALASGGYAPWA